MSAFVKYGFLLSLLALLWATTGCTKQIRSWEPVPEYLMLDCPEFAMLRSDDPNEVLDWLAEEVKPTHEVCKEQYDDLRRAVRARQE